MRGHDGVRLGSLCLLDTVPRNLGGQDLVPLHDLAAMVEQEMAAVRMATMDDLM